nr:hypothetical protein LTR18_006851 [Exophiala xenobiotica]
MLSRKFLGTLKAQDIQNEKDQSTLTHEIPFANTCLLGALSMEQQFDVIVVGGGNTACCAALAAFEAGARVAILEAAPRHERGGNSRFAGTAWRFPHNGKNHLEPLLTQSSLGDLDRCTMGSYTAEQFTQDMLKKSGGRHDRDEIATIVKHGYDTIKWMARHGVPFILPLNMWVQRESSDVVALNPGVPVINQNNGRGLTDAMWAAVEQTSISVFYASPAHDLIAEGDKILGVRVRREDCFVNFYGKVILACGGFEANPRMRRQYLGEGMELSVVRGSRFNTGVMLEKAIDAGAQAQGHWGGYHCAPLDIDTPKVGDFDILDAWERYAFPYSIMVNTSAQRFVDEGEDEPSLTYSKMGAAIVKEQDGKAFQIFDQKVLHLLEPRYKTHATPIEAGSIEDLARKLGLEPKALRKTVDDFNAATPTGKTFDPFQNDGLYTAPSLSPTKSNWAQPLDKPPFVAYAVTTGITFTFGGIKTDRKARVLTNENRPMHGLYAVGEITGGFYFGYAAGASLIRSSVLAKIAGEEAARENPATRSKL